MSSRRARLQCSSGVDEILRNDYPPAVQAHIRMAVKGSKWPKQRCLQCGRRGRNLQIWVARELLSPVPTGDTRQGIRLYWLCDACKAEVHRGTLSEDAVRALLRGQRPSVEPLGAPGAGERREP